MPVYNVGLYLAESIESILNQTFKNFEFIIVDDGSTDNSPQIIQKYASLDPRIKYFLNEHLGLSKSLNFAATQARGHFLARQDGDDLSQSTRLTTQLKFFHQYPKYHLVGTFADEISPSGKFLRHLYYPTDPDHIKALSPVRCCFVHGSVMFKKRSFNQLSGYPENTSYQGIEMEDLALWTHFSQHYATTNINQFLYFLRANPNGVSRKNLSRHSASHLHTQKNLLHLYSEISPQVSVIIPSSSPHHQRVISTLKSCINQTYSQIEIILVSNASRTRHTINQYKKLSPKIFIININQKLGPSTARNIGINWSRSQYLAFLDDDDFWDPKKLELQLEIFRRHSKKRLGLVYTHHYWANSRGRTTGILDWSAHGDIFSKLIKANIITGSASTALITKEAFIKAVGEFNQRIEIGEDWEIWIKIADQYLVDLVPMPLATIRRHHYSTQQYVIYSLRLLSNYFRVYLSVFSIFKRHPTRIAAKYWLEWLFYRLKIDGLLIVDIITIYLRKAYFKSLRQLFLALPKSIRKILTKLKYKIKNM